MYVWMQRRNLCNRMSDYICEMASEMARRQKANIANIRCRQRSLMRYVTTDRMQKKDQDGNGLYGWMDETLCVNVDDMSVRI
jgi:SAM-dependent MidA family methyltransferase